MKNIFRVIIILSIIFIVTGGCRKYADDYKTFLDNHEVTYPGLATGVGYRPGNLRAVLVWHPSPDPSIKNYVVTWNNGKDSLTVDATSHSPADSIKVSIPGLKEYVYSFRIVAHDNSGGTSVGQDLNNVRVYGPVYQSTLLNRAYDISNPYMVRTDGSVDLNFLKADAGNVSTAVEYTTNSSGLKTVALLAKNNVVNLPDFKFGTVVKYQSAYVPASNAADVFTTLEKATFPTIRFIAVCDKSLFRENPLPGDAGIYDSNTTVRKLWDGTVGPQGYPDVFHSDGSHGMPHAITFDMGKVYKKLTSVEETGRSCCNNPDQFEIWGIADIAGAETSLSPRDGGWAAEMTAKGWTLLKDIRRTDDGQNAQKFDFGTVPAVRYIRVRIKHVTTNDSNYSNISEFTFWNEKVD
jgi:hypothetical protein